MSTVQLYLFPEMNTEIEQARTRLSSEPVAPNALEAFVADIRLAIARSPAGSLVVVGCSAVADHVEIADRLLLKKPGVSCSCPNPAMVRMAMPPFVTSGRAQNEVLFDRYFDSLQALNLRYKHRPLVLDNVPAGLHSKLRALRSRTEDVIGTLGERDIALACVTDAQNIASESKRVSEVDRMLQQLRDIAQRTRITHVLIGEMNQLWTAVRHSRLISQIQLVMEPLYDPEIKADHAAFVTMLLAYQKVISKCSDVNLTKRYEPIMARVAGDHRRLSLWLIDALCEAGRSGAEKLEWAHLKSTAPMLDQVNDAKRALTAYLEFRKGKDFDFPDAGTAAKVEPVSPVPKPNGKKLKPFEPVPSRDMVEQVA